MAWVPKSAARLHDEGVDTIGTLATMPDAWFARHFGKRGDSIRDRARGIDLDPVQTSREAKSISAETTFADDLPGNSDEERANLRSIIERLTGRVAGSVSRKGLVARTVTVKMRLSDFTTFTRQTTLPAPTDEESDIVSTVVDAAGARTGARPRLPPPGALASPASPKRRAPTISRRSPWHRSSG